MSRTTTRNVPGSSSPHLPAEVVARIQTRTVWTLVAGQVLGGLGIGATVSFGALLAAHVSGNDALSGTAATLTTLGAAAASIPLARLAQARGRRIALTIGILISALGASIIIAAATIVSFPVLLAGFALLGVGAAVNLQSRFAATDLAAPATRGSQLSLVVWSTTIGAVVGPNLSGPGEAVGEALGMPHLTGSFSFAIVAQLLAAAVYLVALRPDPYLLSRSIANESEPARTDTSGQAGLSERAGTSEQAGRSEQVGESGQAGKSGQVDVAAHVPAPAANAARYEEEAAATSTRRLTIFAISTIAAAHAVMVAVMAMTPLHLNHHGSSDGEIGFTISLHVAGMFALSPVFGKLSDRVGRFPTILLGQAMLAIGLVTVASGEHNAAAVTAGLTFIGLGWSATTVAGSALVASLATDASRTRLQGRSDLFMNIAGAVGGASAGPVLALIGYAGLALAAGVIVVAVVVATVIVAGSTGARGSGGAGGSGSTGSSGGPGGATSAKGGSSRGRGATTPR
jgi:MFS family permease